tara:strand:- start:319 stop:681 length:363 start_codon:yes stop_codon:yes gene_type:complete
MQIQTLPFSGPINSSIQVGDTVYYSALLTVPGTGIQTASSGSAVLLGIVTSIGPTSINVIYDDVSGPALPSTGDYIMFEKNEQVNSSSILGHYADVKLVNYSTDKIELFSIGSEISESSK